jgi:hypothetical protein
VDECEKGIAPKSRLNRTKADVLRRVFAEAGAGATDFSPRGGSTFRSVKKFFHDVFCHPRLQAGTNRENGQWVMSKNLNTLLAAGRNDITL